jgi:MoxR-like ATPase
VWNIYVDETLQDYIIRIVHATRSHPDLALGASPRASLALFKTGQALAAIRGRDHVLPDDIQQLITPVLAHRLLLKPDAELRGHTARTVINDILEKTDLKFETQQN